MNESLAWLRDPELGQAAGELLCGLIRDVRLILVHPDLENAAKLSAITDAVDLLAPPSGPKDGEGQLGDARAAAMVAALLARNRGPATLLFEDLASEPVRIEMAGTASRSLAVPECLELHAERGTCGTERAGTLRTTRSGLAIAEVSSLVVPGRLPASALSALGIASADDPTPPPSDIPLGKVLASLGVRREPLGVRLVRDGVRSVVDGRVAVEASARMWLGDVPVALASERVTTAFCLRAAARVQRTSLACSST